MNTSRSTHPRGVLGTILIGAAVVSSSLTPTSDGWADASGESETAEARATASAPAPDEARSADTSEGEQQLALVFRRAEEVRGDPVRDRDPNETKVAAADSLSGHSPTGVHPEARELFHHGSTSASVGSFPIAIEENVFSHLDDTHGATGHPDSYAITVGRRAKRGVTWTIERCQVTACGPLTIQW